MKKSVIIVAGGKGLRMGTDVPKQFLRIGGKPILMRTMEAFYAYDPQIDIIVVLPDDQQVYWEELCYNDAFVLPHRVVNGGETRFHSVRNGLTLVSPSGLVGVHDGVRPFVSRNVIAACYEAAMKCGAAVPVVDVVETLRRLTDGGSETVERSQYKLVQTPQVFSSELLIKAYEQPYHQSFTDDASVVETFGKSVMLVSGNRENIKITTPFDLTIANALL